MSIWRHLLAILALPAMVVIVIPIILTICFPIVYYDQYLPSFLNNILDFLSHLFIVFSLFLIVRPVMMFDRFGKGTLAPWDPTKKLVVEGIYRHVRNPMISGVFCILFGEALLFKCMSVFIWFLFFVIGNMIYIPISEEPGLVERFGDDYLLYKKNVPRWIPRVKPWDPPFGKVEK